MHLWQGCTRLVIVVAMAVPVAGAAAWPVSGATGPQTHQQARYQADTGGRIAFTKPGQDNPDGTFVYTMRADGTVKRKLLPSQSCCAGWSVDGTRLVVPRLTADDRIASATVRRDGSDYRKLPITDATLNIGCGTGSWSPTAARLTCESWDDGDSDRNGLYMISAHDGRILRRLTRNPFGATDIPGSYSPDGRRIVFVRFDADGNGRGLYVAHADGHGLRRIASAGTRLNIGADWSPSGNDILFSRHVSRDVRGSLWLVHADGSGLTRLDPDGLACGSNFEDPDGIGCHAPVWSPDGTKLAFAAGSDSAGVDIYTMNLDGSDLTRLTSKGGDNPDWARQ